MNTIMDDKEIDTIEDIRRFLAGTLRIKFEIAPAWEAYPWIRGVLIKFEYHRRGKYEKGLLFRYIQKITDYSRAQLFRLINQYRKWGTISRNKKNQRHFPIIYSPHDIALLLSTDNLHRRLSGPATKKILEREYRVFGRGEYKTISGISVSHLYNVRKTRGYIRSSLTFTKTHAVPHPFGERAKPRPNGRPGYIRIDSVHQGDRDKEKGVYHINLVDEVTQWEIVLTVEGISEVFLHPALEEALQQFPFVILGFHSDNGSEYVNETVAKLLNKLLVRFTKSRARRTNDNALVESKNGSIIRKQYGYAHIPKKHARRMNEFNAQFFNIYINYHRPCFFVEIKVNAKGKETKRYPYKKIKTPYQKFKSLPKAEDYLRKEITLQQLGAIADQMSDNQFAKEMRKAEEKMWEEIDRSPLPKRKKHLHKIQFGKGDD